MGWRYIAGRTKECRLVDYTVEVDCGYKKLSYSVNLPFNTDWQRNYFVSDQVVFLLFTADKTRAIIGLRTGDVLLSTLDGYFAGRSTWDVYAIPRLIPVGYRHTSDGMYDVYYNADEERAVHAGRSSVILEQPVSSKLLSGEIDLSSCLADVLKNTKSAALYSDITVASSIWDTDPDKIQAHYIELE